MKFKILILIMFVFMVCVTGCSSTLDNNYGSSHVPPKKSSAYSRKTPSYTKDTPPTQRPYNINGQIYTPIHDATGFIQTGKASWYGSQFHGRKTSNGETYNMYDMTAAHKTLPMNTWVSVHNLENDKKIVVRINDRGPFVSGRIIDLSYTGARQIDLVGPGTAQVKVTALGQASSYSEKTHTPLTFKPVDYWKGNFTVQVAAFKVKSNAINYQNKLSNKYENSHISEFTDDRGTFYRVRIGKFNSLHDAITFSEKIISQGFHSAFAVAE